MSLKNCGVCGRPYRTGRIAYVMGERGLKGKRVCQNCEADGVLVVAARPIATCKKCSKPATVCHEHAGSGKPTGDIAAAIKVLEGRVKAQQQYAHPGGHIEDHTAGTIEGLESAIELLKSGRF